MDREGTVAILSDERMRLKYAINKISFNFSLLEKIEISFPGLISNSLFFFRIDLKQSLEFLQITFTERKSEQLQEVKFLRNPFVSKPFERNRVHRYTRLRVRVRAKGDCIWSYGGS